MKKIVISSLFLLVVIFGLNSCGFNVSSIHNNSVSETSVQLTRNNFKVLSKVSGSSTHTYIFGFLGGLSESALISQAKSNMYDNANLIGESNVIINVTYDVHYTLVLPFYISKKVTASGYLIKFIDK